MAAKKSTHKKSSDESVADYRHAAKRKNIPPAGLAAQGKVREAAKLQFAYDPHLPPALRFDASGASDKLPPLLEKARREKLTSDEAKQLADALRQREPWLEWAGKREKKGFEVEPIALHIHERVSTQAILKIAARQDVPRELFADPQLEYQKAIQFYQHDVDWANRMILGDSLQVMASLARREDLAGKVQMLYVDPPYGIKFASNFQPEIRKRKVEEKESDLTREAETVKAYRDTWTLGVHSYLTYLRDRLWLCKELLADTGSIFVQISDENLHRVRMLMDEVFETKNFCGVIHFKSTTGQTSELVSQVGDYILWYAKDRERVKYRPLFFEKNIEEPSISNKYAEFSDGSRRALSQDEQEDFEKDSDKARLFALDNLTSQSGGEISAFPVEMNGAQFRPDPGFWKTNLVGMSRLRKAERLGVSGKTLRYVRFADDFRVSPINTLWTDTSTGSFTEQKVYVVQTNTKVISRCLLMTTDPGDLVLDPTCGSGTTAYVAEQWGRRWITIDTSRVSLALARQRLLTAKFDFYKFRDESKGVAGGFDCKAVPHITLKSIAQNVALDSIFAKRQPALDAKLSALNAALKKVTSELRQRLKLKLLEREKREGRKSVTEADRRRWLLPTDKWKEWEVPFDSDPDWPKPLQDALAEYRTAWRAKMDEVNGAISASAEQEELVDQPEKVSGIIRVSGPITMEAVMPAEESLAETPIGGEPEPLETFGGKEGTAATETVTSPSAEQEPKNAEAYLDKMLRLLKADGVRFPNNKVAKFARLEPCSGEWLHAEGEWSADNGKLRRVCVSVGPQFGPVTAYQVENALGAAHRRGYDEAVFAGFSFDAAAQAAIQANQDDPGSKVRAHLAHIRPDVTMGDLLKETPSSQIFTVFGSPRTELRQTESGEFEIEMQGVDIYDPVANSLLPTNADKVAAWFVDSDYDGRTFCITQAFFPDKSAWEKLSRALKGVIDEERFAALSGVVSLPFPAGKHKRAAVKVIDPRGNEVLRVVRLNGKTRR